MKLAVFNTEDEEMRKINENFIRTAHSLQGEHGRAAGKKDEASSSFFMKHFWDSFEKGFRHFPRWKQAEEGTLVDDEKWMRAAIEQALLAEKWTEVPHQGGDRAGQGGADCGCPPTPRRRTKPHFAMRRSARLQRRRKHYRGWRLPGCTLCDARTLPDVRWAGDQCTDSASFSARTIKRQGPLGPYMASPKGN